MAKKTKDDLKANIEAALLKSIGQHRHPDTPEDKKEGNISVLATDLAIAIADFFLAQKLTITKFKGSTEVEEISTTAPIQADVIIPPGMINVVGTGGASTNASPIFLKGGCTIAPLKYKNDGSIQGGRMTAIGHTRVGPKAVRQPNADTTDTWNNYTTVQLDPNKIKKLGVTRGRRG